MPHTSWSTFEESSNQPWRPAKAPPREPTTKRPPTFAPRSFKQPPQSNPPIVLSAAGGVSDSAYWLYHPDNQSNGDAGGTAADAPPDEATAYNSSPRTHDFPSSHAPSQQHARTLSPTSLVRYGDGRSQGSRSLTGDDGSHAREKAQAAGWDAPRGSESPARAAEIIECGWVEVDVGPRRPGQKPKGKPHAAYMRPTRASELRSSAADKRRRRLDSAASSRSDSVDAAPSARTASARKRPETSEETPAGGGGSIWQPAFANFACAERAARAAVAEEEDLRRLRIATARLKAVDALAAAGRYPRATSPRRLPRPQSPRTPGAVSRDPPSRAVQAASPAALSPRARADALQSALAHALYGTPIAAGGRRSPGTAGAAARRQSPRSPMPAMPDFLQRQLTHPYGGGVGGWPAACHPRHASASLRREPEPQLNKWLAAGGRGPVVDIPPFEAAGSSVANDSAATRSPGCFDGPFFQPWDRGGGGAGGAARSAWHHPDLGTPDLRVSPARLKAREKRSLYARSPAFA
ncbi:hypothetical protein DIPPA_30390 [Diplonema papillatum]|nr:hypothetical protein DIPPA_30390 [Diplonema papillatum]|eukprot:gene19129-29461_t